MVRKAETKDLPLLAALACRLWPEHSPDQMQAEYAGLMEQRDAACFLAFGAETAVGFAQCGLRHDYVEGTQSSPVGYLEGIFVAEGYRGQGIARKLLSACEGWAKSMGCEEFASDCQLDNAQSLQFHLRAGFAEANRIICFTKQL